MSLSTFNHSVSKTLSVDFFLRPSGVKIEQFKPLLEVAVKNMLFDMQFAL